MKAESHRHELVVRRAEADGLAVLDGGAPVGVRVRGREVVVRDRKSVV